MKKKILAIACSCSMLLSISGLAYSAEGTYVSGSLGVSVPTDSDLSVGGVNVGSVELDNGVALNGAIGYGFGNTRIEGEIGYQKNDLSKWKYPGYTFDVSGSTSSLSLLLNGYYDFKNKSAFTPFLTAGLGFTKIDIDNMSITVPGTGVVSSPSSDDTVFAYQFGFGAGYAINEKVTLDMKYRYFGTSDPDFDGVKAEFSSSNIYAGIRVGF